MCEICEGKDPIELLHEIDENIRLNGFEIIAVEGTLTSPSWAYTVGLSHTVGRPELIVVGVCVDHIQSILTELARLAMYEWAAGVPDRVVVDGQTLRLVAVDRSHWRGDRFAMWKELHEYFGYEAEMQAVQVLAPDENGRYPGDEGIDPLRARRQLLLSVPRIDCGYVRRTGPFQLPSREITPRARRRRRRR